MANNWLGKNQQKAMKATLLTRLLLPLDNVQHIAKVVNVQATTDGITIVGSNRKCICLLKLTKDAFIDYTCTGVSIGLDLNTFRNILQQMGPTLTISMSDTRITVESDNCCVEVNVDRCALNSLSERVYDCVVHVPSKTFARVANLSGAAVHVSCRGDTVEFTSTGPRYSSSIVLDSVVKPSDIELDVDTHYMSIIAKAVKKTAVLSMSPGSIRVECGCEGGHMAWDVSPN